MKTLLALVPATSGAPAAQEGVTLVAVRNSIASGVSYVLGDGSIYALHNRTGGGADNIHQTYVVNLSTEQRSGTWRLRAQDHAGGDVGFIESWTVTL